MEDLEALQRQHKLLSGLRENLEHSLDRLIYDLADEIDAHTGKRAYSVTDVPGMIPLCYGLKWSLKDEPWAVIANAERVIDLMKQMRTEVAAEPHWDALSEIPEDVWEGYMALYQEYLDLRKQWYTVLGTANAYWNEKIVPYLRAGED